MRSPLRRLMIAFGACAILLGLMLPLVLVAAGPSDPLGSYRGAQAAMARAEVVEATRIAGPVSTVRVRHSGQPGGDPPVFLDDYGLGTPRWRDALPVGTALDVVYVRDQPRTNAVPRALLDEIPAPPSPGLLAPLVLLVAYVGAGLALVVAGVRTTEARMQSWLPGRQPGAPRPPRNARGRAVAWKIGAGAVTFLLLPLLLIGLPAYVSTTAQAVASTRWPTAPGQVVLSRVTEQRSTGRRGVTAVTHVPAVAVRYDVGGHGYRTHVVRFDYLPSGKLDDARAVVDRYPPGAAATVHHDPSDPSRAVLEPGPVMPDTALFGALALAAVLGFLWGTLILLRPLPPQAVAASS